jgi:NADH-quinone oxidoreductase subunit L
VFDLTSPLGLLVTAVTLPLIGAILATLLGVSKAWKFAHWPAIVSFAASAVVSLILFVQVSHGHDVLSITGELGTWFSAGRLSVPLAFSVDPLSVVMLVTVSFIATFIAIFSAGYMHGDHGFARYFALMGLFVFSMCLLVTANNFFVLVAGWEGVGVCSYLLVGYYYAKPSAAAAARKAFLVTRLGDVGLILGIFLFWQAGGYHTNFDQLFEHIAKHPPTTATMTTGCLLLFCGAVGKSAQLPLYVWLPDAMEGPTPVSALIHAATMVTAGVFLLARCAPLFAASSDAQIVVCVIGGLTAFLAAFIALAQNDLKRVLAYSTVSQLGFMFMALGAGGAVSPKFAVTAAMFHLFTHAFFKALLFLGSGSVMHAMGNVIDMRKFGGLRNLMPTTHATFLIGAAALAGFPLLSGFWSKDAILHVLKEAGESRSPHSNAYMAIFALADFTALLTAFYTFRAYFLTFWGPEKIPHEAHGHAHESPRIMTVPLIVLAVGALAVGFVVDPLTHGFEHFLDRSPSIELAREAYSKHHNLIEKPVGLDWSVIALSTVLALAGIGLAAMLYRKGGPEHVSPQLQSLYGLSQNKLYVDEIYNAAIVKPAEALATTGRQFDSFLDALARLFSFAPRFFAAALRPLQNGLVQFYALGMVLGLAVFLTVIVFRSAR